MTAPSSIDPARFLSEQLDQASPDLLRQMLSTFIDTLMSAEADAVCGAEYGAGSLERTNTRNGYRHRDFDTRAGTLDVAIPKLRTGSYFPDWLLERRRAERALTTVVATCYLLGVSTRRMEKLVESLGIANLMAACPKNQLAMGAGAAALRLRPARRHQRARPVRPGPRRIEPTDAILTEVLRLSGTVAFWGPAASAGRGEQAQRMRRGRASALPEHQRVRPLTPTVATTSPITRMIGPATAQKVLPLIPLPLMTSVPCRVKSRPRIASTPPTRTHRGFFIFCCSLYLDQ
jgi:hypothetical protein